MLRPLSKSLTISMSICAVLSVIPLSAIASDAVIDIEQGKKQYKKECRGCHGPTAKGLASYPKLREQTAEYLVDKLERYRKGERFGPNTPLMAPRAKKLTDEDISNISAFIVSLDNP
jgi:cytochrome c553